MGHAHTIFLPYEILVPRAEAEHRTCIERLTASKVSMNPPTLACALLLDAQQLGSDLPLGFDLYVAR